MQNLRKEVLQNRLNNQRFGHTIKILVPVRTSTLLLKIKQTSGRTFRDILMVILNVFVHRSTYFSLDLPRGPKTTLHFRVSDVDAAVMVDWSRKYHTWRASLLGRIVCEFLRKVPSEYIIQALSNREDILLRLKEDSDARGRKTRRQARNHTGKGSPFHRRWSHRRLEGGGFRTRARAE